MYDTNNSTTSTNVGDVTHAQLRERLLDADFMQADNPDIPDALRNVWDNITFDASRFDGWAEEGVDLGVSPAFMGTMVGLLHENARDQWVIVVNSYFDMLDKGYDPAFLSLLAELKAAGVEFEVVA